LVPCASCGYENRDDATFCGGCASALHAERLSETPASHTPTPRPSPALPASFADGRYAVHGFLGEGGSKKVYLAHDTRLDRDVALAVVEGLDPGSLERVRREARAVARLGDHPNIVAVFDTAENQGQLLTVYQYMPGGSLADLVAKGPVSFERIVALGAQVCEALAFAHGKGVIHRDVKPANVFLAESGDAKLGDFGLAAALDRTRLTEQGTFLGTAAYMAPEQAMGQPADARSDLYSLGCVLYELVTGRPPFVGDDTVAVVTQHLNTPPVAPSWHRADVRPGLEALVLRLLEKDPGKRPQSAAEAGQALRHIDLAQAPPASGTQPAVLSPQSSDPLYRTVFVGREQELRQLQAAFDTALSGNGGLVMVVGEPGIGKTALTGQLATYVAMRGGRALHGNCYEEGSLSLPYLPFVEAMRSYVLDHDADALRSELGNNAPYVAKIVSEVREKMSVEVPPGGDPEDERWRLLQGVTTFLKNAASVQPLMLLLEDLHWSDRGTLDLLNHLGRNLEGARLLVVGTYRDVEVDRSHPLSAALAELRRSTNFSRVTLRGLGIDDVAKMLSAIAGRDVPRQVADQVHRQTEGNPLFVQEVVRYLVEEGVLKRESGGQASHPDSSLAMQIPEGLRDVIGKRLSRLSPETNRVLSVAAVIGREFRLDVLQDVAGVTEEELYAALEEASGRGVIEERRQTGAIGYRFTHAFLRQTLYEEIFTPRRIRTHQQVARAMEERYASRVDEHAAELAEHFAQSTDPEDLGKAVHYGGLAAKRAMSVYAYAEAAGQLEAALQAQELLDPDDKATHCELLLTLGDALLPTADASRVVLGLAEEAFQLASACDDRAAKFRACRLQREGLARIGASRYEGTPESRVWAERALSLATPNTEEEVWALLYHARDKGCEGDEGASWDIRARALALAEKLDDREAYWAAVGQQIILPRTLPFFQAQLRLAGRFMDENPAIRSGRALGLLYLGCLRSHLHTGDRERVERVRAELRRLADKTGDSLFLGLSQAAEVFHLLLEGQLSEAIDSGLAAFDRNLQFGMMAGMLANQALEYLGREQRVETWRPLLDLPEAPMAEPFEAARRVRNHPEGERGLAYAGARSELLAPAVHGGFGLLLDIPLLLVALSVPDRELASVLYKRLCGEDFRPSGQNSTQSVGRLLGDAALLLGDPVAARKHFGVSIEACAKLGNRPELAITRFHLARLLLDQYPDERAEAFAHLDFAIGEFQAMKMAPSLEEAMHVRLHASGADTADPTSSIVAVINAVQAERPDLSRQAAPDGTVTIMFTDIENSTSLTEQLGDAKWIDLLREHNAVVEDEAQTHGGKVVKNRGDGYMLTFRRPDRALDCAVAIQQALVGHEVIRVRIGLHIGNPVREGEDFFGTDVNLAARVADRALGGQVFVSARLHDLLKDEHAGRFGEPVEVELKGFAGAHRIYAVVGA
jgi:eukaryotic-like serine/threonine-protein kinase